MKIKDNKILCQKCNHWIGVVGTKWEHISTEKIYDYDSKYNKVLIDSIKHDSKCYCNCNEPTP